MRMRCVCIYIYIYIYIYTTYTRTHKINIIIRYNFFLSIARQCNQVSSTAVDLKQPKTQLHGPGSSVIDGAVFFSRKVSAFLGQILLFVSLCPKYSVSSLHFIFCQNQLYFSQNPSCNMTGFCEMAFVKVDDPGGHLFSDRA